MPEMSAAEVYEGLPQSLVEEAERVQGRDPEALARIVAYGLTRRMIFEHLLSREGDLKGGSGSGY